MLRVAAGSQSRIQGTTYLEGFLTANHLLVYVFDGRGGVCIGCVPARVGVDGSWMGANFKASYLFFSI
jgi:hypothetical protein